MELMLRTKFDELVPKEITDIMDRTFTWSEENEIGKDSLQI